MNTIFFARLADLSDRLNNALETLPSGDTVDMPYVRRTDDLSDVSLETEDNPLGIDF